jgi:hypothetical protein
VKLLSWELVGVLGAGPWLLGKPLERWADEELRTSIPNKHSMRG